jgi:hypothetical protein
MFVVLNSDGFYVATLHQVTEADMSRSDVLEVPDQEGLTSAWKLVGGVWVAPAGIPVEPLPEGVFFATAPVRP